MKNFRDSDYARNKTNPTAIVYSFVDGSSYEYTIEDYLAENPGKTPADFQELKDWSDNDYYERDRKENAQTKRNVSLDEADKLGLCRAPSVEEEIDSAERALEFDAAYQRKLNTAGRALDKLTETQRRRYIKYHVKHLSSWQIADSESINQKSVYESLMAAEKKVIKVLAAG